MLDRIGNWKLKILETGDFKLDGGAMMGTVPKVLWEKTNPSDKLIDRFIIKVFTDDGNRRVLIETGIGNKFNENLKKCLLLSRVTLL